MIKTCPWYISHHCGFEFSIDLHINCLIPIFQPRSYFRVFHIMQLHSQIALLPSPNGFHFSVQGLSCPPFILSGILRSYKHIRAESLSTFNQDMNTYQSVHRAIATWCNRTIVFTLNLMRKRWGREKGDFCRTTLIRVPLLGLTDQKISSPWSDLVWCVWWSGVAGGQL